MPLKLKAKVCTATVLLCGSEIIQIRKKDERPLEATGIRVLRWLARISLFDYRINEGIRRFLVVEYISDGARAACIGTK